jgi:hypothetical protein
VVLLDQEHLYNESGAVPYHLREVADFVSFFDGPELVDPGVVPLGDWRPDDDNRADVDGYCGVVRKPWPDRTH